ncbi:MAG: FtsX-like permease family protein, partial [Bacteroidota bacterium]
VGASRGELMGQFFLEAFLMSFFSVVFALVIVYFALPWFNELLDKQIQLDPTSGRFWQLIAGVLVLTTLVAGSYPALLLSSFSIQNILKGKLGEKIEGVNVRRGLVVFQFFISSFLLLAALAVRSQVYYIKSKNLGLDRNNVIYLRTQNELTDKYDLAKERLLAHPAIAEVTGSESSPLNIGSSTGDPTWEGFTEEKRAIFRRLVADYDFFETMRIPLKEGRYFDPERKADSTSIIINERAAQQMEMESPLGQMVNFWGVDWNIIGVVEDFHLSSLHDAIEPLITVPYDQQLGYLFVRPAGGEVEEAISALREVQQAVAPAVPFDYSFLDTQFESMYKSETTTSSLADLFAIIALFVSALGLLGLAAFAAERRTREIGIRKVLGATVFNLITLLSKEFVQLILLAFLIAIPLSWYFVSQWLESF